MWLAGSQTATILELEELSRLMEVARAFTLYGPPFNIAPIVQCHPCQQWKQTLRRTSLLQQSIHGLLPLATAATLEPSREEPTAVEVVAYLTRYRIK